MNNPRKVHTDDQLKFAAKYFVYHIRMYVDTLLLLQSYECLEGWNTVRNAVLEAHLVHARVLINFICNSTARENDILAIDYFHDSLIKFHSLQDDFLNRQAINIGGQLVHLTIKAMNKLKSEQEWNVREVTTKLVPALEEFLNKVNESRFSKEVRIECLKYLAKLILSEIPLSASPST